MVYKQINPNTKNVSPYPISVCNNYKKDIDNTKLAIHPRKWPNALPVPLK